MTDIQPRFCLEWSGDEGGMSMSGYRYSSWRTTPLVHPNPAYVGDGAEVKDTRYYNISYTCILYSPPLPGSPSSVQSYYGGKCEGHVGVMWESCGSHVRVMWGIWLITHPCTLIPTHTILSVTYRHTVSTFSNIVWLNFSQARKVVVSHVLATFSAASLRTALGESCHAATNIHCRGGHAFGKSHCCVEFSHKEVGTPPGYSRTPSKLSVERNFSSCSTPPWPHLHISGANDEP